MSWTSTIPIWDGRGWTGTLDDCRSARGGCRRGALAGMPSSRARFTRQRLRRLRSPRRSRPRAPCTWPQTGGGPSPRRSRPPPAGATRRSSPSRTRAQPVPVFSAITVSRERALARNSGQSKCAGTGGGGATTATASGTGILPFPPFVFGPMGPAYFMRACMYTGFVRILRRASALTFALSIRNRGAS